MNYLMKHKILPAIAVGFSLILLSFFSSPVRAVSPDPGEPIELDPKVIHGRLDNGLTYYVQRNDNPYNRAFFYLVQKVGSINEEDNQRGLAHFLEHMAFNGTEHFPGRSLIKFLRQNGVSFGGDLNAFTAYDKTVYRIDNVTARDELIDSCLLILHDWSGCITLDGEEIDSERKVITEEWRSRNSGKAAMEARLFPQIFPEGSRYPLRDPIGLMEVVNTFPHDELRDYYARWYRPDLQAVVVVGHFDAEKVAEKIRQLWSDIPAKTGAPERVYFDIPDNEEPIVAVALDPDARRSSIDLQFKYDPLPFDRRRTVEWQARQLRQSFVSRLLADRLSETASRKGSPLLSAAAYTGSFSVSATKRALTLGATYPGNDWQPALNALVGEAKRVRELGFTPEEFSELRAKMTAELERTRPGGGSRSSSSIVDKYLDNFTEGYPAPSPQTQYELTKALLADLTLDEVNAEASSLIGDSGRNLVIIIRGEERPDRSYPDRPTVVRAFFEAEKLPSEPYEASRRSLDLIDPPLEGGRVLAADTVVGLDGVTRLTLSNGARVFLAPSGRKSGRVTLRAVSKGGFSLFDAADFPNYSVMNMVIPLGGLGNLSASDLARLKSERRISCEASVGPLEESVTASAFTDDLPLLFRMLHLAMTEAPADADMFAFWKDSYLRSMEARPDNPYALLSDSMTVALYGRDNPRNPLPSMEMARGVDYERIRSLYLSRFADAADFSFLIAGDFDVDGIMPLVERYLASLPGCPDCPREDFDASAVSIPQPGGRSLRLAAPMSSPKTTVLFNVSAPSADPVSDRRALQILRMVLKDRFTDELREKEGGTYGVNVSADIARVPGDVMTLSVSFDTNPLQAEPLLRAVSSGIDRIASQGISTEELDKARDYLLKDYYSSRGSDEFMLGLMNDYALYGTTEALAYSEALRALTPDSVTRLAAAFAASPDRTDIILTGEPKQPK